MMTENLAPMTEIDRQFLETPFYGVRQMTWHLRAKGWTVNVKPVRRLMRLMGLMPIYQQPRTSVPAKGHKRYPYLLRELKIERPNQVWCADITYIPLAKGFLYLVAIMDWHSRKVLAWRLSNNMDVQFCIDALEEALDRHGCPEIFNTDQGSQFTSWAWTHCLKEAGVRISMDGRGRFLDNLRPAYAAPLAPRSSLSHRTAVAVAQIRVRLPVCLLGWERRQGRDRPVDRLL